MDWNNVDVSENSSERDAKIIDSYSFDTLLLEIACNVKEINEETVKAQFLESLNAKIQSAREVFRANLENIVKQAQKERNRD